MKLANLGSTLSLLDDRGALDVETVASGALAAGPPALFDRWDHFTWWVSDNSSVVPG